MAREVMEVSDNEESDGQQDSLNGKTNGGKNWIEMNEENKRLKKLIVKYETESKAIISKASTLREREKTALLQTLELFKLNNYLISRLPDSQRVLDDYLKTSTSKVNGGPKPSTSNASARKEKRKDSNASPTSSSNKISNYFKSMDKTSGANDASDDSRRRSPRKVEPKPNKVLKPKTRNLLMSSDSEPEEPLEPQRTQKTKRGRAGPKSRKRTTSDTESQTLDDSMDSQSLDKSESKKGKEKKASGPKRQRKTRDSQPSGYFPCTFDAKQCDAVMDTKEHFEFHMKGHYDAKYVCPYCAYTGQTIQIIKRHINTEREAAKKAEDEKKGLTEDQSAHKDMKIYKCFGCKVCNKIHDKLEKRCEHIDEDTDNECDFAHDIDYQFKDHLKKHFNELFIAIKDKDKRRDKIRPIVDKFCEELYFENSAKKKVLIEKFHKSKDGNEGGDKRPVVMESDDDWDD